MSASISCSSRALRALERIRSGDEPDHEEARALGEQCPREFFGILVEALADSFDAGEVAAYERLMRAWIPACPVTAAPVVPARVNLVYVLSRVTLGSDIKITSALLDAATVRFPDARIVLVGGRKSAELFAADRRIGHLEANYPRSGAVSERLAFAEELRRQLDARHRLVIDPDTRMTQLGLLPVCEPERYFHFRSREAGGETEEDLSRLVRGWFNAVFGATPFERLTYIAPEPVTVAGGGPQACVSLGVGGNDAKRVGGNFEPRLVAELARRFESVWIDRGAGGEEAERVTSAVRQAGAPDGVRFWEGSFAGFASLIAQSDFYLGYDSAGQHAAAAAGTGLVTVFAGAPSRRFQQRWAPSGRGFRAVVEADGKAADEILAEVLRELPGA